MYLLKADSDKYGSIMVKKNLTIGRSEECDIPIDSNIVSSKHLKIYLEESILFIEDLNSANGTYIDGKKVEPNRKFEIKNGQKIAIGDVIYTLVIKKERGNLTRVLDHSETNGKDSYTIGRDIDCDISIESNTVSSEQLIVQKQDGRWYIIDNDSTNGTFLNSYDNKITKVELQKDQILYLATYKLNTNKIFDLINGKEKSIQKISVSKDKILIGRDPNCDMPIKHPNISWNHSKIVKENSKYFIYDLNSTNGTFVNSDVVKNKREIKEEDKITLGIYSFIFKTNRDRNLTLINIENVSPKITTLKKAA